MKAIYEKMNEIITGTGTINNTYISEVENNHYEKYGKVVSYAFTVKIKGTWDTTTAFITGLPRAKVGTRFVGTDGNNGLVYRFAIDENGNILNQYSRKTPESGMTLEGQVTYISID